MCLRIDVPQVVPSGASAQYRGFSGDTTARAQGPRSEQGNAIC